MKTAAAVCRPAILLTLVAASVGGQALAETTTVPASASAIVVIPQRDAEPIFESDSTSCGFANRGALAAGVPLPATGEGFATVEPWLSRGHRFGTGELVALIERVAAEVNAEHPGAVLGVADLSREGGGAAVGHRSHQSGRDVDFVYYALDDDGRPFYPDSNMAYFGGDGVARFARQPSYNDKISVRYFDPARNWALIKALLTDSEVKVTQLFVSSRVERWLLDYARGTGEPKELVEQAARLLWRPRGADPHNDHIHVRIACSEEDKELGRCHDGIRKRRGRSKWRVAVTCPVPVEN